jgi:predicted nucleic acid-binding protein
LVQLDNEIALKAAEFKHDGLYMVDAIVYATAIQHDTKLLTGDKHFKDYENVVFLE